MYSSFDILIIIIYFNYLFIHLYKKNLFSYFLNFLLIIL